MANVSVRKLDVQTLRAIQAQAAQHGGSMEVKIRQILRRAANTPDNLGQLAQQFFGQAHGVDLPPLPRNSHSPLKFDE